MRQSSQKTLSRFAVAVLMAFFGMNLLVFQNCSQVGFGKDMLPVEQAAGAGMIIEDGKSVTNKSNLKVAITGQSDVFTQMRISTKADFSDTTWVPYNQSFSFDLGSEYAQGGGKDGLKTIYAELRMSPAIPSITLEGRINLDTVAPKMTAKGILASGMQGVAYKKGDAVTLNWDIQDPQANGYSSGLDDAGMKIGVSATADCGSSSVQWLNDWGTPADHLDNFSWPSASPLDSFYVCGLVKDRAGNVSSMLSEPLTSVWRVLAGDNNQGNGGSVTAANVRFKQPGALAVDSKGNLFNVDHQFHVIRKIASQDFDTARTISTFAGTGHTTGSTQGLATNIVLPATANSFIFDSKDRLFYYNNGQVNRITTDPNGVSTSQALITACGSIAFTVRNVKGTESLLVHMNCSQDPTKVDDDYLYEIPMADLDSITTTPLNNTSLKAKYITAGNGTVESSTFTVPKTITLSKTDGTKNSSDMNYSLGSAAALVMGDQGELYLATVANGSGQPWGHHTIRKFAQNADGTWTVTLLTAASLGNQVAWTNQMAFVPATATTGAALLAGTQGGLKRIELVPAKAGANLKVSDVFPQYSSELFSGVIRAGSMYYASISSKSQIFHFDFSATPVVPREVFGRPVYRAEEDVATQAMLGQPEGMTQNPVDGTTYFFDAVNHIVRSISSDGKIATVAGTPQVPASQVAVNLPLEQMKLNGLGVFNGGYMYNLTGDFSADGKTKRLYLAEGSTGHLHQLDLITDKANTIGSQPAAGKSAVNSSLTWPIAGLTKVSNGPILAVRYCPGAIATCNPYSFTGNITGVDLAINPMLDVSLAGNLAQDASVFFSSSTNINVSGTTPSNVVIYGSPALRADSTGMVYWSYNGLQAAKLTNGALGTIANIAVNGSSRFNIPIFEMIEDGTDRLFIYQSGEGLAYVRVPQANIAQASGVTLAKLVPQSLCLPGTFVNGVRSFALSGDGNLLISDTKNGRILEYYLRDSSGHLKLSSCTN